MCVCKDQIRVTGISIISDIHNYSLKHFIIEKYIERIINKFPVSIIEFTFSNLFDIQLCLSSEQIMLNIPFLHILYVLVIHVN